MFIGLVFSKQVFKLKKIPYRKDLNSIIKTRNNTEYWLFTNQKCKLKGDSMFFNVEVKKKIGEEETSLSYWENMGYPSSCPAGECVNW